MTPKSKESFLSALRHLLTAAGGIFVSRGYLSKEEAVQLGGALLILAGFLWGTLDEWLAAKRIEDEALITERIHIAVEAALKSQNPNSKIQTTELAP